MQFSMKTIAAIAGLLGASQTLACCHSSCYAVKGESYDGEGCPADSMTGASVANYGSSGVCIDIASASTIMAHNDGCGSSHPDFHFYQVEGCPDGDTGGQVVRKNGGGQCFDKPIGAKSMIVVAN